MASKPAAWPLQRAIKRIQAGLPHHTMVGSCFKDPKRIQSGTGKVRTFMGKYGGNGQNGILFGQICECHKPFMGM